MKYSKIYKFVKDRTEFKKINEVILNNYEIIYEQYILGQAMSNYPSVTMIDFGKFCKDWNIIGKSVTMTDIDRLFVAVNYEEVGGTN